MFSPIRASARLWTDLQACSQCQSQRYASNLSAIKRGLRREEGEGDEQRQAGRRNRDRTPGKLNSRRIVRKIVRRMHMPPLSDFKPPDEGQDVPKKWPWAKEPVEDPEKIRKKPFSGKLYGPHDSRRKPSPSKRLLVHSEEEKWNPIKAQWNPAQELFHKHRRVDVERLSKPPREQPYDYVSIPYTTAASEFLYGLNVVYAALKANRRQLHKLYIHQRATNNVFKGVELGELAASLPGASNIIKYVGDDFLPVMDKMTDGRPHNGIILEASPLPLPVVQDLAQMSAYKPGIVLNLVRTDFSDQRAFFSNTKTIPGPESADNWRQPFVLFVDGVLDPGNLGNIIRTAYFYGVDAVAVSVNTCAPLSSAVVHKAASGAAEAMQILAVNRPADFLTYSGRNGWWVHGAIAPDTVLDEASTRKLMLHTSQMTSPLKRAPSILMIGAEGAGLRENLIAKARAFVAVDGSDTTREDDLGIDSLNVGAATAVLIDSFMRRPFVTRAKTGTEQQ